VSKRHPKQQAILKAIRKTPEITVRELQATCKITSTSVVQHHLLVLQADGIIRKVNRWEIIEEDGQ
jgi:DNA-binding MarR family transcriptional regulator